MANYAGEMFSAYRLRKCGHADFLQLPGWFASADEVFEWTGNNIAYPIDPEHLIKKLGAEHLFSFCLIESTTKKMVAFGQTMLSGNRIHLARLCVHPEYRNRGLGAKLVVKLATYSANYFGVKVASLFVYPDNKPAYHLYQKLGFRQTKYYAPLPNPKSCYMEAALLTLQKASE